MRNRRLRPGRLHQCEEGLSLHSCDWQRLRQGKWIYLFLPDIHRLLSILWIWLAFFSSPPCKWRLCVWKTLCNLVCFWHLSTYTWFSTWFISVSTLMETLVPEVSSLLELFTFCDLTLFLSQILDFYFYFLWWHMAAVFCPSWAFLSTWPTSLFLPLSSLPHPKTTFPDNSGCFLASWACLFISLWGNGSLSYPATMSRQNIVSSPTLKSSITGAIFFSPPPPSFSSSQKGNESDGF